MDDKQYVSRLIVSVITGRLPVREALLHFPKDTDDVNIITAYHALAHYEADEDMRALDSEYKEEQDNYLIFISELLENGKDLPKNIIKSYEPYYEIYHLPSASKFKTIIEAVCKFLKI